jgi:hypothetical protein
MNAFKAEVNKIILALISVGIVILMILPVNLFAAHFRYGTMSWELTGNDNATHTEILLKMQSGWDNSGWASAYFDQVGEINNNWIDKIQWGDGDNETADVKTISVDTDSDSTIVEMGDNSSPSWVTGVTHSFANNGTYVIVWASGNRIPNIKNMDNSSKWRLETKVTIGGDFAGNISPVSAVPPIVQVQDNKTFTYQVSATDANSDSLSYRWGTYKEFVDNTSDTTYAKPTGMILSSSGLVTWNVQNSGGQATDTGDIWLAFIVVEDLDSSSGDNKSYIPIDFFFKITDPTNDPPVITGIPSGTQTVSVGSTKTFTITSTDDSGVAPTITVLNPPSDNSSIWDNTTSTSGGTRTFTINFTPDSSMGGKTYVVNVRSTDNASMTQDQSFSIQVSSVANADPTAPTLISPANGDNVTSPVTFRFAASTDSDGDNISYTMYICGRSDFVGDNCSGTSVTAGGNFVPPFNQNFDDNLIPWPSPLYAATISQQISQEFSMIPKLFILLGVLGLLSVIISLSVKNITHRRIVYVLFLIIIGTVSCSTSSSNEDELDEENKTDNTTTSTDTTAPTVSSVSTTADNQSSVSVTDNITVTFSEAMDTTFVTTSTSDTYCAGTIRVSSDNFSTCVKMSSAPASSNSNKTFTLDPYDYLTVLTTYLTRVTTGVKDTAGNAMSSQYETSSGFTTDNISTAKLSVSNSGLTTSTTYYWKVVASDPKGGSAQSETWSFTVQ